MMAEARLVVGALCLMLLPAAGRAQAQTELPSPGELAAQLQQTTLEAESLYSQASSRAAAGLQRFLDAVPGFIRDASVRADRRALHGPRPCLATFNERLKRIRHNAHIMAEYNAENHQKFFLSHMIVFRMHLNRSADLIKRAETALRTCPSPCQSTETLHNLNRWHRSAFEEIHRVKDDLQHSRLAYKDLLTHGHRRLNRIRRRAEREVLAAVSERQQCAGV